MWIRPEHYRIVGACLAAARRDAGVTQDELAARLQKPQSFISAYERGQRRVDLLEFLTIIDAIGADAPTVFAAISAEARETMGEAGKPARRRT